ncbi:MAG: DUF2393 domain-containing protein [Sulfurimonas sp.]|uniref:DUF2393 family protein n=1 Tax=Sulfurimonas sp. TaxID=2022749 RepID=UPI0025F554F8|nr:DUF2393 family protein [Sulfurimonas sp.]MCK9490592.1 DUF2393 domain-containing protein [Sulfurimonas sp.]
MQLTTLFNYWHYIALLIVILIFAGGIFSAYKQKDQKLVLPIVISTTLISLLLGVFSIVLVDKYTKKVSISKVENKRLLSIEKIAYSGIVRNEGNHEIGEVVVEIKLINKGHATGNVKGGNYFKSSGFFGFFTGSGNPSYKPQTIIKEFVVAKNLKPGQSESFRVYFDWPPYFRHVADFVTVEGH